MRKPLLVSLLFLPLIAACETPVGTADDVSLQAAHARGAASAAGGGEFTIGALIVQFAFNAVQTGQSGAAVGHARHSVELAGELVEFHTSVTCMSVDAANGRAWIGGTILVNNSTHPSFTGAINQPGADIWFRVVDYGEGSVASQADRATFVGFEGSADIITSDEYCTTQPWPDNDDRTNPVTVGNLKVRG
jgi:hypothetical protein